ncbi:MAG TPA: hypothetical protein VHC22_22655 [Pirellulales bacterium]|nr:hypothetical protein [Pirellulales bacterium]
MSEGSEKLGCRRLPLGMMVVVAAIVLANAASSQPMTIEYLDQTVARGKSAELAYGWPLSWYWRTRVEDPGSEWPTTSHWPVSRYSASHLLADAAVWIVLLVAAAGSQWVLRRYQPRIRWRPPITTVVPVILVSVLTVLANLSSEWPGRRVYNSNYGWPFAWYWHVELHYPVVSPTYFLEWDYGAALLAGNLVLWLLMLAATAFAWERLMRHYRRRLRWSLRAMLVGVAVVAAPCAWFAVARDRANRQEAFVESLGIYDEGSRNDWLGIEQRDVYVERGAPKWLSVVGADRFCRHIVGVRFAALYENNDAEQNRQVFKQLAHLPSLRLLDIQPDTTPHVYPREFTPDMAAILSEMRHLRILNLDCRGAYGTETLDDHRQSTRNAAHHYLAAIGKLTALERLRLSLWPCSAGDLARLAPLVNLKTLALDINPAGTLLFAVLDEPDTETEVLAHLPVLPGLEQLDLHGSWVGDDDLDRLSGFERLRTLNLSMTLVTGAGLAKLAPLTSLEELAIGVDMATAEGFEALARLERLRTVHIANADESGTGLWLPLDNAGRLAVWAIEADDQRRALEKLRQARPDMVIDADYDNFEKLSTLEIPWEDDVRPFAQKWIHGR